MAFGIGGLEKIGIGIGLGAMGGGLGSLLEPLAAQEFSKLMGANGQSGVSNFAALGTGGGLLGAGLQPQIANQALSLFGDATTPGQKMKLLDVAIYALGGQPGSMPGGMSSLSTPAGELANLNLAPPLNPALESSVAPDTSAPDTSAPDTSAADPAATTGGAVGASAAATASAVGSASTDSSSMSVNGNTVDTGRYTVTASKDDGGTVKIFDKQTNSFIKTFGDPHMVTSDGDKAQFQKDGCSIKLPDGTEVHMKPTAPGADGKSYLDKVMVEKGGQAVTMTGLHDGSLTTSQPQASTPEMESGYIGQGQTVLTADASDIGKLSLTDANGRTTTSLTSKTDETLLDGMGGSLGAPTSATAGAAVSGSAFAYNPQAIEKLGQIMYLTAANVQNPAMSQAMYGNMQNVLASYMQPTSVQ